MTAFDALVAATLIGILVAVGTHQLTLAVRVSREVALQSELANIRTALRLFAQVNGGHPARLEDLVERRYLAEHAGAPLLPEEAPVSAPVFRRVYLDARARDAQGRILDPFGEPYRYDPGRGEVKSALARYAAW